MLAVELTGHATHVYDALLDQGFIVARRPNAEVLRLDPALTIEKETLDQFLSALREILDKLNESI